MTNVCGNVCFGICDDAVAIPFTYFTLSTLMKKLTAVSCIAATVI